MKKILVAVMATVALVGVMNLPAHAQSARQRDKNNMRNLGVGLGAAAVYEATRHHNTNAIVLGAGAAYAGKKYEDARKAQRKENRITRRYVYKNGKRIGYYRYRHGERIGFVRYRG